MIRRVTGKWLSALAFSIALLTYGPHLLADMSDIDVRAGQPAYSGAATSIPGPSSHAPSAREKIVDGKVRIRRVEIRGEALFPHHGVTNEYISRRLNRYVGENSSWMSISEMHRLADDLTLAYHKKGLTFNQVFVLPQEIHNETLILNVLAGRLAEVNIINNALYERDQIATPFEPLLGNVIYEPDIRQAMDKLNKLPGLHVFGFYSVGRRQGETRLNLRVQRETSHSTTIGLDNWGVQTTGNTRLTLGHTQNNLAGLGDRLQFMLMATSETGNMYGGIQYGAPWNMSTQLTGGLSRNQFEIAGELAQFGLQGTLETLNVTTDVELLEEPLAKARALFDIGVKRSVVSSDLFREIFEEEIDYVTLEAGIRISVLRPDIRISQGLYLAPLAGMVTHTDNTQVDDDFWGLKLQYAIQHLWRLSWLEGHLSTFAFHSLLTESAIPDAERQVMTGAVSVRGYEPALFSADQVYRLTLEHALKSLPPLAGVTTTPFLFVDGVYGKQNDDFANTAAFVAAGMGIELVAKPYLSGKVTIGFPLSESSSAPLAEEDFNPMLYAQFGLQF